MNIEKKIHKILLEKKILYINDKFSWKTHSRAVAHYCPQHIDPDKFNWEKNSYTVLLCCPQKLDLNKASLQNIKEKSHRYKNMSLKEIKNLAVINKL